MASRRALRAERARASEGDAEEAGSGLQMVEEGRGDAKGGAPSSGDDDKPIAELEDKGSDEAEKDDKDEKTANDKVPVAEGKGAGAGGEAHRAGRRNQRKGTSGGADDEDIDGTNENNNNEQDMMLGPLRVLEPVRQDPIKGLQQRQKRLERLSAAAIPEIHFVGSIVSGRNLLGDITEGVSCRWKVDTGKSWQLLGGDIQGQTQISYAAVRDNEPVPFNHPLDLHFSEAGLPGWGAPRMSFQCYRMDWCGRRILVGYGFEHLPNTPGVHTLEVNLWRPAGDNEQELDAYLLGRTPALVSHEPIYESAWKERCRLVTVPAGSVTIQLAVMTRNMKAAGIDETRVE